MNRKPRIKIGLFTILLIHLLASEVCAQGFTNISSALGLQFGYIGLEYGGGVSFADFNGDGMDDLTFATGANYPLRFFQNNGNGFTELPNLVSNLDDIKQVLWVDYDNDGDLDLYTTSRQINRLYNNTGDLQFVDATLNAGFSDPVDAQSYCAVWFDYDQDGLPDLCASFRISHLVGVLKLYHNVGNGQFEDVTTAAGFGGLGNSVLAMATMDMDKDGLEDIFVGQDFLAGCLMMRNNGDGTFQDISLVTNANIENNSMTVTVGDFNTDGWMDVYLTDTGNNGNSLLQNNSGNFYSNSAALNGVQMFQFTFSALFFDADNDMDLDLHVNTTTSNYPAMFENPGGGMPFEYKTAEWGFAGNNQYSIGLAGGDYNNDGYVDLAVSNANGTFNTFWENNFTENNYLVVKLVGTVSNVEAIGAVIEANVDGIKLLRNVGCGSGFSSQNSYTQYFGLGSAEVIDTLTVFWPSGEVNIYTDVTVNEKIVLTEIVSLIGCTDVTACNYNPLATESDNSCVYADLYLDCMGNCLNDVDGDLVCDELEIFGCTDPLACNYEPEATENSLNCTFPELYYDCFGACLADEDEDGICDELEILGCTDFDACNFDPLATDSANTCIYAPNLVVTGLISTPFESVENYSVVLEDGQTVSWTVSGNNTILTSANEPEVQIQWNEVGIHQITALGTVGKDCIGENAFLEVEVTSTVGIFSNEKTNWLLFPNPCRANGILTFKGNFAESLEIQIVDVTGRIVIQTTLQSGESQLSLNKIQSGYYQVIIKHQQQSVVQSLVVTEY